MQCGQAGNQLGQELWGLFASQPAQTADGLDSSSEFFREDSQGLRRARCLLVDTEPKVVCLWILRLSSRGEVLCVGLVRTVCMPVCERIIFLPKLRHIHRTYMVLANPMHKRESGLFL